MDSWPEWKAKLLELSKLESKTRPSIKRALNALENEDNKEYEGKAGCISNYKGLLVSKRAMHIQENTFVINI